MSHVLGAVLVIIDSIPICAVIKELSFIDVSIKVIEDALPVGLALAPLTLILGSVTPNLLAMTVFYHEVRRLGGRGDLNRGGEQLLNLA